MNPNKALWEKGDFTRIAASMRPVRPRRRLCRPHASNAKITINTSPTDFAPISQLQLMRFKGETWELFGEILSGDVGG